MFIKKVDIWNFADDNNLYKSSPNLLNNYKSMIFQLSQTGLGKIH